MKKKTVVQRWIKINILIQEAWNGESVNVFILREPFITDALLLFYNYIL